MTAPDTLLCEKCGTESRVVFTGGLSVRGFPMQWPKFKTRDGALYVFLECPECGEREQAVATAADVPTNGAAPPAF
jgi:hypothetical protein